MADLPPLSQAIRAAAERLDHRATQDTIDALMPWLDHRSYCRTKRSTTVPCDCGLAAGLVALLLPAGTGEPE